MKEEEVEEEEMYVVPKNEIFEDDDMDAEDSYDLGDDMSEEDARGKKYNRDHKTKGQVPTKEPAKCWQHFEKVKVPSKTEQGVEVSKARCKHCFDLYAYVQGSSTSTLNRHYKKKCKVLNKKLARAKIQSRLGYKPSNGTRIPAVVSPIGYDHATIKELIAKMIAVHGYSFGMVEHEWFNTVMKYLNPRYQFIGRKEIRDECMRVFNKEKEVLKSALENVEYISLTADLWTSNQTISYIRVVAHYIDEHWKMQTRVLAFMELDPSHAGHLIADAIFDCVTEWKIENKVVSITLENAAKDDLVRHLKAKFAVRRGMNFEVKYFHVRCCAHVINLMVQDGTTCMTPLINNLRETMKYLKKSPSRLQKFVDNCKILGVEIGEHLNLDVCTRWSSTYKMLKTGLPYRQALASYAVSDAKYKWEPTSKEWDLFEVIEPLLCSLALLTTAFSAQGYLTTNIFYLHITCIKIALREAMVHKDKTYKAMGIAMMDKLNMYWEEMNNVMVLATILDPRYKMMYVEWFFRQTYDEETAEIELADVRKEFETLYEKYDAQKRQAKQRSGESSSKPSCMTNSSMTPTHCEFQAFLLATSSRPSKSELRNYIEDQTEKMIPEFNLLEWWKVNAPRYPVLANMARRFLTIPASSMSLESTFSTGGRVLDGFRSSLKPAMVEALMCVASYIKGAHKDLNVVDGEEDEEDVQTIKLPKTVLDCNY